METVGVGSARQPNVELVRFLAAEVERSAWYGRELSRLLAASVAQRYVAREISESVAASLGAAILDLLMHSSEVSLEKRASESALLGAFPESIQEPVTVKQRRRVNPNLKLLTKAERRVRERVPARDIQNALAEIMKDNNLTQLSLKQHSDLIDVVFDRRFPALRDIPTHERNRTIIDATNNRTRGVVLRGKDRRRYLIIAGK